MGFRSWSKAVRELDWNVSWTVAVSKDTDVGTSKIDVYVKHITTAGEPVVTPVLTDYSVSAPSSAEFEVMGNLIDLAPAGAQFKLNGGLVRGIQAVDIPDPADTNQKYYLVVKNTGTAPVTVFDAYASPRKIYPGETAVPEASDAELLTSEEAAFFLDERFSAIRDAIGMFISSNPFPADLTALFETLSATSTPAEIQAVLDSSAFQTYYSTSFPRRPDIRYKLLVDNNPVGTFADLAPGAEVSINFTTAMINYYFTKLSFN